MLKRIAIFGLVVGGLLTAAPRAEAVALTGGLSLSAVAIVNGDPVIPVNGVTGAATTLDVATGLDFGSIAHGVPTNGINGVFQVDSAVGNFTPLVGLNGIIRDFSFAGAGSLNYPLAPIANFEAIAGPGFAFDLLTVTITTQSATFLNLQGTGLFHLAGFDNTLGVFSFTVTQVGAVFSFAGAEGVTAVPEPGSMILLGTGLMGLAGAVRRRLASKK